MDTYICIHSHFFFLPRRRQDLKIEFHLLFNLPRGQLRGLCAKWGTWRCDLANIWSCPQSHGLASPSLSLSLCLSLSLVPFPLALKESKYFITHIYDALCCRGIDREGEGGREEAGREKNFWDAKLPSGTIKAVKKFSHTQIHTRTHMPAVC